MKVGDKVICIDAKHGGIPKLITEGNIYTISAISGMFGKETKGNTFVGLKEKNETKGEWLASRFRPLQITKWRQEI